MIGLFFEDINYAADGGLYAELLENRSFEFLDAGGDAGDYYTVYDGGYAWSAYPNRKAAVLRTVMGSPLTEENPHYMRVETTTSMAGLTNKGYDGICLKEGLNYHITFWARCVKYNGNFCVWAEKDGQIATCPVYSGEAAGSTGSAKISARDGKDESPNYYKRYELTLQAAETLSGARFVLCLDEPGIVEFDFISMFPGDAVAGLFRRDLFELLRDLKPGFLRFPGGCIVEGNTLANRYRFKDSLKPVWARRNNWNRWAVHENCPENNFHSNYSHYNQTLGLGFYEYFLLCELIGAKPLPVLAVGFACQYQSTEQVGIDSPEFQECLQDALDLLEFANGGTDTKWGAVRAQMGHAKPFGLELLGIGNEQWQTERADFFERYTAFEKAIHAYDPAVRLIGSAGPDITSKRYTAAWDFYRKHQQQQSFAYAVDEHYYVKPEWLLEHTDFYDNYPREVKVFAGEYAAHPLSGMNRADANTLEGALAEAAFLTGVERNADVVVLASYAPLFARIGYAQWSPDLIWFDAQRAYVSPSYHVQKMYSHNLGTVTLDTADAEKEAAKRGIYYSLSCLEKNGTQDSLILKIVNTRDTECQIHLSPDPIWGERTYFQAQLLTGNASETVHSLKIPEQATLRECQGRVKDGLALPAHSFAVVRL